MKMSLILIKEFAHYCFSDVLKLMVGHLDALRAVVFPFLKRVAQVAALHRYIAEQTRDLM